MNKLFQCAALLLMSFIGTAQTSDDYKVLFINGSIEPLVLEDLPYESTEVSPDEIFDGRIYRLVQFASIPTGQTLENLKMIGFVLHEYIPNNAYIASFPFSLTNDALKNLGCRSITSLGASQKLNKYILSGDIGDWALDGDALSVVLKHWPSIDYRFVEKELREAGVLVTGYHKDYSIIKAVVNINDVYALADLKTIQYAEVAPDPGTPEDREGRSLHRSNRINTDGKLGRKYDGTGVSVLTRDDGVVGPHLDFHGRLDNLQTTGILGTIDHSDMVSGIFAGAGNINPLAEGMASGAFLYVVNYKDDFLDNTLDLHQQQGVKVTNSSYSNGCNAGYTSITQTVDKQIEENPTLLHVFSAGNSGSLDCNYGAGQFWGNITGGHKIGKNVIATANLRVDISLENSSSRGPASDGRIKPDISARGTDQLSLDPNNNYSPGGGTSAASPGIAGISAQLIHGFKTINNGQEPESALIKAAMLNTANDLGNPGPDFKFGWGHVNAFKALKVFEDSSYIKSTIGQGEQHNVPFAIPSDSREMRVMLYWKEPQAAINSAPSLVNNLDLSITTPSGETLYPWLLNSFPDKDSLNLPAKHGVDKLNNVEQIIIDNREDGDYIINVDGTTLPFGSREYYLIFSSTTEDITVTYPIGGEGFVPGETEQIHWDAGKGPGSFDLTYSTDGGMTWDFIGTGTSSQRAWSWIVPNEVSSKCLVKVTRDNQESSNAENFSIVGLVNGVKVTQVCPSYIRLEWNEVAGADGYDIYKLGDKHMEIVDHATTNVHDLMVDNPLEEFWFSIRASGSDELIGRRNIATYYEGGLMDCEAENDAGIVRLISPNENLVYTCGDFDEPVMVEVENLGKNDITDVTIHYEVDNGPTVSETFNNIITVGSSSILTFSSNLSIAQEGDHHIKLWMEVADDEVSGNNSVDRTFKIIEQTGSAATLEFTQDFEIPGFPPLNWYVESDIPEVQWMRTRVTGITGASTNCMSLSNQTRNETLLNDNIYSEPIDLTGSTKPTVFFDYAYYQSANTSLSGTPTTSKVALVIYAYCNGQREQKVIFETIGSIFQTTAPTGDASWVPASGNDWSKIGFNLSEFAGQEVRIGFLVENGFNYNFYVDNLNVREADFDFPDPDYSISNETPCSTFDQIELTASEVDTTLEYKWSFGERASPPTAIGPGPHKTRYFTTGEKLIRLEVVNPDNGAYGYKEKYITVYSRPSANFNSSIAGRTVTFEDRSSNAIAWSWDFGDTNTSTDQHPVHTYANDGEYTVSLTTMSECGERTRNADIQIGSVNIVDQLSFSASINPNPFNDKFFIDINGFTGKEAYIEVLDLNGRTLTSETFVKDGQVVFNGQSWDKGMYLLKITEGDKTKVSKVVKQ